MTLTSAARAIAAACIKPDEACRLSAYRDSGGVWTAGWGSTFMPSGRRVQAGDRLTQRQADDLLDDQIDEWGVVIAKQVRTSLTDAQAGALCSAVHNLGPGLLATGNVITDMLNASLTERGLRQLWGWCVGTQGGVRGPMLGLMRRRAMEVQVSLGAVPGPARDAAWKLGDAALMPFYHQACEDAATYRNGTATWEVHPVTQAAQAVHAGTPAGKPPVTRPVAQASGQQSTADLNDAQLASIQGAG